MGCCCGVLGSRMAPSGCGCPPLLRESGAEHGPIYSRQCTQRGSTCVCHRRATAGTAGRGQTVWGPGEPCRAVPFRAVPFCAVPCRAAPPTDAVPSLRPQQCSDPTLGMESWGDAERWHPVGSPFWGARGSRTLLSSHTRIQGTHGVGRGRRAPSSGITGRATGTVVAAQCQPRAGKC